MTRNLSPFAIVRTASAVVGVRVCGANHALKVVIT